MKVSLTIARVRGEFIDGAGADMKNLIRDIQRRRPMRYNKTSFSGFVAQIFKQMPFGFPVERGSRFVQQQYGAFGKKRSRDGQTL